MNSAEIAQYFSRSKKKRKLCKGVPPVSLYTKKKSINAGKTPYHSFI